MFGRNSKILRLLVVGLWLLVPITVLGYSHPESSTSLFQGENGQWILEIQAARSAFDEVVHDEYPVEGYCPPEAFEELITSLLSKHLSLYFNSRNVTLNNPMVTLGNEVTVNYKIDDPGQLETVDIENTFFRHIYNSRSAMVVLKNGMERNLLTLDKNNDYIAHLTMENDGFAVDDEPYGIVGNFQNILFIVAFVVTLMAFGLVVGLKPLRITNVS